MRPNAAVEPVAGVWMVRPVGGRVKTFIGAGRTIIHRLPPPQDRSHADIRPDLQSLPSMYRPHRNSTPGPTLDMNAPSFLVPGANTHCDSLSMRGDCTFCQIGAGFPLGGNHSTYVCRDLFVAVDVPIWPKVIQERAYRIVDFLL